MEKIPAAQKTWTKEARTLWRDVLKEWTIGPDSLEVLRTACDSLDRYIKAKKILDTEGLTFTTNSGQVKKHPCCEIVKNERAGFLSAMKALNLSSGDGDDDEPYLGRPTAYESWKKKKD